MDNINCPVCGGNAEQLAASGDSVSINCSKCGEYDIAGSIVATEQLETLDPDERRGALDMAKQSAQPGTRPMITVDLLASVVP
jgi:hypothetical protein